MILKKVEESIRIMRENNYTRLKEMKYRDEKTKRDQQILNQYESVLYDAELEEEEDSFIENTSPEEITVFN